MTAADLAALRREAEEADAAVALAFAHAQAVRAALREAEEVERREAIIDALALYSGTAHAKAKALAGDLGSYAGNAWPRDRDAGAPPAFTSDRRSAWFRILSSRNGEPLGWRRISDLAEVCNPSALRLQTSRCDSSSKQIAG